MSRAFWGFLGTIVLSGRPKLYALVLASCRPTIIYATDTQGNTVACLKTVRAGIKLLPNPKDWREFSLLTLSTSSTHWNVLSARLTQLYVHIFLLWLKYFLWLLNHLYFFPKNDHYRCQLNYKTGRCLQIHFRTVHNNTDALFFYFL